MPLCTAVVEQDNCNEKASFPDVNGVTDHLNPVLDSAEFVYKVRWFFEFPVKGPRLLSE